MKRLPSSCRRTLIRIAYLLPAISGLILLVYALIPHLYFVYENTAYETLGTFTLVSNTFAECNALLSGTTEGSAGAIFFAYGMSVFAVLFWIALALYGVTATAAAVTSVRAFSAEPTSRESNRAKRWLRFFCPNRGVYVFCNLLLLLAAAFPQILVWFYHSQLGYTDMQLHFFGPPGLVWALLSVLLSVGSFLALLPAQAEEHLDMFRLYKAKS